MSTVRTRSATQKSSQTREDKALERMLAKAPTNIVIDEAIQYTLDDEYWYKIFLQASRGKFPLGYYVRGEIIYYKKNKTDIKKKKLPSEPFEMFKQLKDFLFTSSGIESDKDIRRKKDEASFAQKIAPKKKTNEVNKQQLYEFVKRCSDDWELDEQDYKSYKSAAFTIASLTKKKFIVYDENDEEIVDIENIHYDENRRTYFIDNSVLQDARSKFSTRKYDSVWKSHPMYNARSKKFESLESFSEGLSELQNTNSPEDVLYVP